MLGSLEPTAFVKTILSFREMCEDLLLERVVVVRQLSSSTSCKCIVRKKFVDESGIRVRYDRYIAKVVIDGTINYTPISFDAINSVCALPEPSKNTELFNLLYALNEETRGCIKQEWDNIRWNNYYPRCRSLLSWAVLQLHNSIYLRIGTGIVGREMCHKPYEEATPQLLSMWECMLLCLIL